jgi:hypothetical protein
VLGQASVIVPSSRLGRSRSKPSTDPGFEPRLAWQAKSMLGVRVKNAHGIVGVETTISWSLDSEARLELQMKIEALVALKGC